MKLRPRELQVLKLIATDHTTKEIAESLGMSFKTADKHRQLLMDKLGLNSAVALTHYALRHKLVKLL